MGTTCPHCKKTHQLTTAPGALCLCPECMRGFQTASTLSVAPAYVDAKARQEYLITLFAGPIGQHRRAKGQHLQANIMVGLLAVGLWFPLAWIVLAAIWICDLIVAWRKL